MVAYLALCWTGEAPPGLALARERLAEHPDWAAAVDEAGLLLATRGPVFPKVRKLPAGRGWVVGDLFPRRGAPYGSEADTLMISLNAPALAIAARLRDDAWGRYVALIDPGRETAAVFRDPSGAADALAWRARPLRLVGSHLPDWLPDLAWPGLELDWAVIARWLSTQSAGAVRSGLRAVASITPGALWTWNRDERQVWRPADFASVQCGDPQGAGDALPGLLDACVGALTTDAEGLLAEVSGGLDSAIVASALALGPKDRVRAWLNQHAPDGSGDELSFARQVAGMWDVELTEALKSPLVFMHQAVEAGAQGLRPGFHALDFARDRDVADLVRALQVDRVVTGQGGDMVFFNMPTPVITADALRQSHFLGGWAYLRDVAALTRQSVWRTAVQALDPRAAWDGEASVADHPWMQGTARLAPGKRCHIAMLAQKLTLNIENQRGRWAEVLNPLLAQPIVEHCLAIPVPVLTAGGRDRALARQVFSGRIPDAVRDRREKGDFGTYYTRAVADGLDMLRPYLLEGRLAAQGLIDRDRFDRLLTREALIWQAETAPIMSALMVEAWVRTWTEKARARASRPATSG